MMNKRNGIVVGASQSPDSEQAGQQAAQQAVEQLEPHETAAWALVFCGGRHDHQAVLRGLRSKLGEAEIVGGAAIGTITNCSLGYTGHECAVAVFSNTIPKPTVLAMSELDKGETEVGQQLGAKLRDIANEGDTVLLFYDSIRSGPPPVLYIGSRLLNGIYQGLAGKDLKLIGAGTIGDFQFSNSYVFDGHQGLKHAVVAVVLPSILKSHTTIMHGCIPASAFLEITKIDDAVVYELDGRPALQVLGDMFGPSQSSAVKDNLSLSVTLGEKHGDVYAPYDESAYVNRLILGSNPADGSVTLFEADFEVGTRVQVMSRDNQVMIESVNQRTKELLTCLEQTNPIFALYIDCAGRTCGFSGAEAEEADIVKAELGQRVPLLGFYSGVEIAPLMGRSRPLDWTGVLTLFTLEDDVD